jgi:hypothetical protein
MDCEKIKNHLNRVIKEIIKLNEELSIGTDIGDFENRLLWAIRGVNPHMAICKKHNQKIGRNEWGEYLCGYCVDELVNNEISHVDENLYFDPNDEPLIKIIGIQYGVPE